MFFSAESQSSTDDDYEYVSTVVKDTNSPFAPGGLGELHHMHTKSSF